MALNDNSQFNSDGAGSNDNQAGWLRAIAMWCLGILPSNSAQINAASGDVANSAAVATLPAPGAGKYNYLSGFEITGAGATAGATVRVTVTGVVGGTLTFSYSAATGAAVGNFPLDLDFNPPLKAALPNTAIVVTCPALGAGNLHNSVNAHGFSA